MPPVPCFLILENPSAPKSSKHKHAQRKTTKQIVFLVVLKMEETELQLGLGLGLPGGGGGTKRGFAETETEITTSSSNLVDLSLNLNFSKQALMDEIEKIKENKSFTAPPKPHFADPSNPPAAKAQVVGWPPVRSFRKNMVTASQVPKKDDSSESITVAAHGAAFVKVSMDGAPYLRKVDLKMYKSYKDLSDALVKMFDSFISGSAGSQSQGMKDFMNEKKSVDLLNGSDYVSTFEDKDGDWMLVGDVPWEMFIDSCKRLRIMSGSDAIGLSPKAAETSSSRERKTAFHRPMTQAAQYDRQSKVFLTKQK